MLAGEVEQASWDCQLRLRTAQREGSGALRRRAEPWLRKIVI
jgi:hypothetical protein